MTVKSCHTASFDRPKLQFKPYLKLPVPIPDEEKKLTQIFIFKLFVVPQKVL